MKKLFFILSAVLTWVACEKGGDDESSKSITVTNQQQLTQTVYADDNAGKSSVTFTTTGAWTSEISESATVKSTRTAADWVSISPSSGDKAGDYTIQLSLLTNYTGKKRSATISLKCSGELVSIVITQEAVTAAGDVPKPDPEPSGEGLLTNETSSQSVKLTGAKLSIMNPSQVSVQFIGEKLYDEDNKEVWFDVTFANPLANGKLKAGTYQIHFSGVSPHPSLTDGECYFSKSTLYYLASGTIKVELNGDIYKFTFNGMTVDTNYKITGAFTGVPEYLNKEVKVASITLSETSKTLEMGEKLSLIATVLPENATDKRYTWISSNPGVATVSEEGLVESVAAGNTTITVTSLEGAKTATCAVTVKPAVAVTGITVEPTTVALFEGDHYPFVNEDHIKVLPANAFNKNYTWQSSNESIATYTGKVIEAKSAGEATLTFTTEDNAKTATLKVTVSKRPTSGSGTITRVDPSGKYETLVHNLIRVDHTILSKNCVELSFINSLGSVVGKFEFNNPLTSGRLAAGTYSCAYPKTGASGTFSNINSGEWGNSRAGTITVGVSGDKYTITMNVTATGNGFTFSGSYSGSLTYTNEYVDVSSVQLSEASKSLAVGKSFILTATVLPANAFNKKVTWSSSDSSVASIYVRQDGNCDIYAGKVGTATVTASTEDGAKTATCQVTVTALPSTGSGTFTNNQSQSLTIDRAEQWINEKEPREIEIRLAKPNSAYSNLTLMLARAASDTAALKAGTYTSISNLSCDELGVKYSSENTGSVIVALNGDNYTVTLNVTSSGGTRITGTYTGKIPGVQ